MTETIHYAADVIALNEGHILLIQRGWAPFKGLWALPGGHVDAGETSRTAAARELHEETGVRVDPASLQQAGVWDEPGRDPRGRYVSIAYLATLPQAVAPTAGDDACAARWWPLHDLPPLAFDHAAIIRAAAARNVSTLHG